MSTVSETPGCHGCPMARLFPENSFVPPKMPTANKDLVRLVIAEAPGEEEAKRLEPLVGGSGKVFDKLCAKVGIPRDGLTISNCIQCRPPSNVFPTDPGGRAYISKQEADQSIKHCRKAHLQPLLDSRKWKRIDLLGDKPLRFVAERREGISTLRGSPISLPGSGVLNVMATYHPSYLMRDQSMLPVAANDLVKSLVAPPEFYDPYPTLEQVQAFRATRFAFDIECPKYRTMGPNAPAEMVGLCSEANHAMCVPIRGLYAAELKRIFRNATEVIGHNCLQFDLPKLQLVDIKIDESTCRVHDTMLQQHLLFPDFPHDLGFVGSQFVSKPAWKDDKSLGWETYCCRDTDVTFQCWQQLFPMLRKEQMTDLYWDVQVPMARICYLMHQTGFKVNSSRIQFVREKLLNELEEEEKWLPDFLRSQSVAIRKRTLAPPGTLGKSGKPVKYIMEAASESVVPWRSPAQKARYLYSRDEGCLGQEPIVDPKSGNVTTGKVALSKLYSKTKVRAVEALRRLNALDETLSTFAKAEMVKIERMYPHFNVHGTATGRLSSSDPNLQNIPETARVIYVPSYPGWELMSVDFSGIENILCAYFAEDSERLKKLMQPGFSEHKLATELFFGISYADVIKDNSKDAPYHKAKTIVHGTDGGMGYKKIAFIDDMDLKEARTLQDKWKAYIAPTIKWQQRIGEEAQKKGVLTNPFGRKRWFWTSSAYTEGVRTPAQSTAFDIIARSMIGLMYERIGLSVTLARKVCPMAVALPKPAQLLLSVHDELVLEYPIEIREQVKQAVSQVMTQPWGPLGGLAFPVGIHTSSESWGEMV